MREQYLVIQSGKVLDWCSSLKEAREKAEGVVSRQHNEGDPEPVALVAHVLGTVKTSTRTQWDTHAGWAK